MPDVITIRGAFRYVSRDALEEALWAARMLLDERPPPLRFRCWITPRHTLSIDLQVSMFVEHDIAPRVCELLGATATAARCVVRVKEKLLADGTGSRVVAATSRAA
jgi:hypothetical protein